MKTRGLHRRTRSLNRFSVGEATHRLPLGPIPQRARHVATVRPTTYRPVLEELEGSEGVHGSVQRAEGTVPRCQATVEEFEKLE